MGNGRAEGMVLWYGQVRHAHMPRQTHRLPSTQSTEGRRFFRHRAGRRTAALRAPWVGRGKASWHRPPLTLQAVFKRVGDNTRLLPTYSPLTSMHLEDVEYDISADIPVISGHCGLLAKHHKLFARASATTARTTWRLRHRSTLGPRHRCLDVARIPHR